jgi:hypothetical protein
MKMYEDDFGGMCLDLSMEELRNLNPEFAATMIDRMTDDIYQGFFESNFNNGKIIYTSTALADEAWNAAYEQIENLPNMTINYDMTREWSDFLLYCDGDEISIPRGEHGSIECMPNAIIGSSEDVGDDMYDFFRTKFEEEMKKRHPDTVRCNKYGFYYIHTEEEG